MISNIVGDMNYPMTNGEVLQLKKGVTVKVCIEFWLS